VSSDIFGMFEVLGMAWNWALSKCQNFEWIVLRHVYVDRFVWSILVYGFGWAI